MSQTEARSDRTRVILFVSGFLRKYLSHVVPLSWPRRCTRTVVAQAITAVDQALEAGSRELEKLEKDRRG